MTQPARSLALLSTLFTLAACTPAPDIEFRDSGPPLGGCPPSGCPSNSPRVNDYMIPELNLEGVYNDDDVRVVGFRSPTDELFEVTISNDRLLATNGQDPAVKGDSLVGWQLELETLAGDTLELRVMKYTEADLSMSNYNQKLAAYALAYPDPDTPGRYLNICPEQLYDPYATVVTVIGGETYDRGAITVNPGMTGWFTLACSEEAVYKMKMMGYSPNLPLGLGPAPSTWQQRQATLKMITADYCGDGVSHTEQGTKVLWHNLDGSVGAPDTTSPIEAHWDHDGAMCLTNRRRPELTVDCDEPIPDCLVTPVAGYEWTTRIPPVEDEEEGTSTGP